MKLSRRTNTIILWLISIGLLVSMIIAFTPTLGGIFGSGPAQTVAPALLVNGQPITELELARARQNPPFNVNYEGETGEDLNLLLVSSLIQDKVLQQAASGIRVTDAEVRTAVNDWRQANGVAGSANDRAYQNTIARFGFDDASFRAFWREQLREQKYREGLIADVAVSDAEIEQFYSLNLERYQREQRILARQIVLEDEVGANDVYQRILAGEDFATLASELSLERADRAGALGAPEGSTEPQPVGIAALPTAVANAAFALQGSGLTEVIPSGNRFYIVNVEEFLPPGPRPFEEVRDEVREQALAARQNQVLEQTFERLVAEANIDIPAGSLVTYNDEVVATVGDAQIKRSELARVVYSDPQIAQALNPQMASLITGLFKPSYLERLVEGELAFQGSQELGLDLIGSRGQIAQSALSHVAKDVSATEEELLEFYEANLSRFTVPARAVVTRLDFGNLEDAAGFRQAMLSGAELAEASEAFSAAVIDLGTVNPGNLQLELDRALFGTDGFDPLPDSSEEISDILVLVDTVEIPVDNELEIIAEADEAEVADATDDATTDDADISEDAEGAIDSGLPETTETRTEIRETFVVLQATRTPESTRAFEAVRSQVEESVLQQKRAELQRDWLSELRERIPVTNLLAQASPDDLEAPFAFETTPLDEDTDTGTADVSDDADDVQNDDGSQETSPSEDGAGIVDDAAEAVEEATDTATEIAAEAVDAATEAATEATEAVTEAASQAVDAATEAVTEATEVAEGVTEVVETGTGESELLESSVATSVLPTIADSASREIAEATAAALTAELRALSGRSNLSEAEVQELALLRANLEKVQSEVVAFRGARAAYVVQEGDTLSGIAADFYGDPGQWEGILTANGYLIEDADLIFPGFVLLIPELQE